MDIAQVSLNGPVGILSFFQWLGPRSQLWQHIASQIPCYSYSTGQVYCYLRSSAVPPSDYSTARA